MKKYNLLLGFGLIIVFSIIFLYFRYFYNSYIHYNGGNCNICKNSKGYHIHSLNENYNSIKKYDNYANNSVECILCKTYPNYLHIHVFEKPQNF